MKRISLMLLSLLVLVISGCTEQSVKPVTEQTEPSVTEPPAAVEPAQTVEITLEELSEFSGKDGARAYVAVDGVIYDVTDVPPWAGGTHQGKVEAGNDVSQMILQSPHGKKVLEKLPVVGKIKL